MLPCKFPKDIESCNRDIYFDPCITKKGQLKEVSFQGRKLAGKEHNLDGYEGRVMGLASDHIDSDTLQRTIKFEQIAKFDKVTEW